MARVEPSNTPGLPIGERSRIEHHGKASGGIAQGRELVAPAVGHDEATALERKQGRCCLENRRFSRLERFQDAQLNGGEHQGPEVGSGHSERTAFRLRKYAMAAW
jgi:hypothetical protein